MLYCIKEKGYENLCSPHFAVKANHINLLIFFVPWIFISGPNNVALNTQVNEKLGGKKNEVCISILKCRSDFGM